MTTFLVTLTKECVVFRKLKKGSRPLTVVNNRLYRVDDDLAWSDVSSETTLIPYDLDEQQPWGDGEYLDPEYTKVMIDSLKLGKGKVDKLSNWTFDKIASVVMLVIIVWAIGSQYLG